ncbi:hypothetical protein ACHAPU_004084 [Fusarium lateritium]
MPRSSKTNSGKSQQVLRRSTRSTRGQLDPFLQANYLVGEAAGRASSAPRRRRATRTTSAAGSAADGDEEDDEEEEEGEGEEDDGEDEEDDGDGDDEEDAQTDSHDEIQDSIIVASQISQPNHVQQFPLQQQQVQQSQSISPVQVQQTETPAPANQPTAVQQDQTIMLHRVENFETILMILDQDPLFDGVPQDWSIPEL